MNRWLQICLAVGISIALHGASLREALNELKDNPHGFAFIDVGMMEEDLPKFGLIDIQKERVYHQFGELETIQAGIADFFAKAGHNEPEFAWQMATRIAQIVHETVEGSGRETAWVLLHAFTPIPMYNLPHWHMDGPYYMATEPDDLVFKVVVTLMGPPTLFYLLPPELHKKARANISNRPYIKKFCLPEKIVKPSPGQGAVFIAGWGAGTAALHTEPPIHENRLFLSIVPCMEEKLAAIKARVLTMYPKDSRDLFN